MTYVIYSRMVCGNGTGYEDLSLILVSLVLHKQLIQDLFPVVACTICSVLVVFGRSVHTALLGVH